MGRKAKGRTWREASLSEKTRQEFEQKRSEKAKRKRRADAEQARKKKRRSEKLARRLNHG